MYKNISIIWEQRRVMSHTQSKAKLKKVSDSICLNNTTISVHFSL